MTIEELEKKLKIGKLDSLYLLYGEEQYLLEQCTKRIKKNFGELINGINYVQIDEKNVDKLISDIETPAFGYPKKLIIAKNTGIFKREGKGKTGGASKEVKDKINDYLKTLDYSKKKPEAKRKRTSQLKEIKKAKVCKKKYQNI